MARASRQILPKETAIMDAGMQALEDHDGEDAEIVDEYIKVWNGGLEPNCERA